MPNKFKLSGRILLSLMIFVVLSLALIWVAEISIVGGVTKVVTISQVKKAAGAMADNIDNPNVQALADNLAYVKDITIMLLNEDGETQYLTETRSSVVSQLAVAELKIKIDEAKEDKERQYLEQITRDNLLDDLSEMDFKGNYFDSEDTPVSYIYTRLTTNASGETVAIIVEATGTSSALINETMLFQVSLASIVILLATIVLSILMSKYIAKPIVSLNLSAKDLAKGKSVKFSGGGYKEIEELRDSLNIASKELAEVDHYRTELIANVSHDLRTPLTLIKGYSELMRDIPEERSADNLQVVIDEAERLTGLVNDMLQLSRLQEGGAALNEEYFDIVDLTAEIVGRYDKMLKAKGYTFKYQHQENVTVYADKQKISQVIYNLLSNAVNYSGDEKLVMIREYKRNNNVRIDFIDHGEGIDVSVLPYIWDRYYKSEKAHKRAFVGTGLGLSIVKTAISMHPGGVYGVESSKGNGSKFYFELPIANMQ